MRFIIALFAIGATLAQDCPTCPEPIQCPDGQMVCSSMPFPPTCPSCPTPDGCTDVQCPNEWCQDNTMPSGRPQQPWEEEPFQCPNICPTDTPGPDMIACPVDYDGNGCPMPITYVPSDATMCGQTLDQACPRSNGPDGCPVQPLCGPEEMMCTPPAPPPPADGSFVCPPVGWCQPSQMPIGRDGFLCPQSCPVECPEGEVVCPVDYDNNGCPMPLACSGPAPEGQDPMTFCPKSAGPNGCLYTPQPDCPSTDQACPIGADSQGCHMGFNCHPMTEDCPMPSLPPPSL